jgi:chitodextrinase
MDQVSFYTSTGKPELKFTDKKIVPNTTYYYAVKARFTDGTMTILSQSVEVTTTE